MQVEGTLVLVDLLRDFVEPDGALTCGPDGLEATHRAAHYLALWREKGLPVIHLMDRHRPDDQEFLVWPPHCVEGTPGAQPHPDVEPRPGEVVIPKRRYSGFFGTDLDNLLREQGTKTINLVGVCTNICVLYTAADAKMRGYDVRVLEDACASYDPDAHRFAIREMKDTLKVRVT